MKVKNISHKFRFEIINETRNYFLEETEQNELMTRKCKKVYMTLNYLNTFFI